MANLLGAPIMAATHLREPLSILLQMSDRVPAAVIDEIEPSLRRLMTSSPVPHPFFGNATDIRGRAAATLAAIAPDRIRPAELWELMSGDKDQRAAAVVAVARTNQPDQITALAALAHDKEPWVRAVVANRLTRWAAADIAREDSIALLEHVLVDSGTLVARMTAVLIEDLPSQTVAQRLAAILAQSPSATVRYAASQVAENSAPGVHGEVSNR